MKLLLFRARLLSAARSVPLRNSSERCSGAAIASTRPPLGVPWSGLVSDTDLKIHSAAIGESPT
jgi:hypothetical protein